MKRVNLLIATMNRGKLGEMREMLGRLPVEIVSLEAYPDLVPPIEDQETFAGNARVKALYYAALTHCLTLADDSGLEVDALGGEPGVRSARYAGEPGDDAANNAKLIAALSHVPEGQRTARFRCAMALALDERVLAESVGAIDGVIIDQPRGRNGFGYDPHFFVPRLGLTTAQMPPGQKNYVSHRGQALRRIRPAIESIAGGLARP